MIDSNTTTTNTTANEDDAVNSTMMPRQRVSIADSMRELSVDLQQLEDLGLCLDPLHRPSSAEVEHILITDSWSCGVCGTTNDAICPSTGKPHRRRLVSLTQHALRLIERHVGKVCMRPASLSQQVEGEVQVRTQRRLTMNPHTFLLAFYFAAQATPEIVDGPRHQPPSVGSAAATANGGNVGALTVESARHLLDVVREIKLCGALPTDEGYCRSLLKSMRSAWRQYASQVKSELASDRGGASQLARKASLSGGEAPQSTTDARDELVSCTRQALIEAVAQSRKDSENADLKKFTALLYQRLSRLCTKSEFADVKRRVEQIEARGFTPRTEYTSPPFLFSDANTTASEDDGEAASAILATSRGQTVRSPSTGATPRAGPVLPPGWHVDEQGRSRPPADLKEREKRERYLQKEFKAQKAYEAVMQTEFGNKKSEPAPNAVITVLTQAELQQLATDLNRTPPRFQRLSRLIAQVEERFVEALPPRLRPRVRQEFHDVLDWNVIQRQVAGNTANMSNLVRFVAQKVMESSSPAREEATAARMAAVCDDIEHCRPDVGTAVASAFDFLFNAIQELREDVAKFSLVMINASLKQNAVKFIRDFISTCLPQPQKWTGSISFLQRFINDERVLAWTSSNIPQAWMSTTEDERRVRGALLIGTLDLLRSGHRTSLNRWSDLPGEIFYFEKHIIFRVANTIQESTLLLLLDGIISSVLARRGMKAVVVTDVIRHLHQRILTLLSEDIRLDELKGTVVDYIEDQAYQAHVGDGEQDAASLAELALHTTLTESEKQTVQGTIDKMTNTEDPLYITFERRLLQSAESMLMTSSDDVAPVGLVTDSLKRAVAQLRDVLLFHWEVYAPYYRALLPGLEMNSTTRSS